MRKKQVATVEEVGTRLMEWRQSRQKGAAIPDELWSAAIEVARRDGVTRTATALHLDGGKLKRLMLAADGVEKKSTRPCAIELEGRRARIRIELKANAADVVSFSRTMAELVL
jgi:hypothetical protein